MLIFNLLICYLFIYFSTVFSNLGNRKYEKIKPDSGYAYNIYAVLTAVVSIINFSFFTKFSYKIDFKVCILSFFYAIVCCAGYRVNLKNLVKNNIFIISSSNQSASLLVPMLIYPIFLKESISASTVAGAILSVISSLILLPIKGKEKNKIHLPLLCLGMSISASSVILLKLMTKYCGIENYFTYCLWTNIFILIISATALFSGKHKEMTVAKEIKQFKPRHFLLILVIATMTNLSTVPSQYILSHIDVIAHTIINASVGLLSTTTVSLLFKQQVGVKQLISILFSLAAAIIPLML